ncbi:MAG: glycoside hydrolase family 127 protein [Pirellulaceae bacterium]|nr:glycoside hydrolase family 127 protein [Pirellulaceae bacterium]
MKHGKNLTAVLLAASLAIPSGRAIEDSAPAAERVTQAELERSVESAHGVLWGKFIGAEGLVHDYVGELPTPEECAAGKPNAIGWWSPIENGPMFTGTYLAAMCQRARRSGTEADREGARRLARGLIACASVSDVPGFIARGMGTDGKCHYPMGSQDQTHPWFYGLHAYATSGIPDVKERKAVADKMQEVAEALEAADWKCPCDGSFKGQSRGDFKMFRHHGVAMYLFILRAMHDVTGDPVWLERYQRAKHERCEKTGKTRLEICAEGYPYDRDQIKNIDHGQLWIYVSSQGGLARLADWETDQDAQAQYRAGLAVNACGALAVIESFKTFDNSDSKVFGHARWREAYPAWFPQKTQADAERLAATGDRTILGDRKHYEASRMRNPLAAAALVALAGYRDGFEPVRRAICHYDYAKLNMAEFFFAECAYYALLTELAGQANYARPFEPPARKAFLPLPLGLVEPEGWLRDWCLAARDGYTGHMDDVDIEFRRAWAADHKMTGERLNWPQGAWPYEGGGYWFDGLTRLGYVLHDDSLLQQAQRRFDVVVDNMHPNSILFLWWLDKNQPADAKSVEAGDAWSLWASGLLGRALAAYYDGSRDPRVLKALELAYGTDRDWPCMGWGMSNPWPAFDTWTWTGNEQIAAWLTTLFATGSGKHPGGTSWNRYRRMPKPEPGEEASDHVVHFLESTTPWVLGYLWTGNREFLDVTLAWHDLLEREAMQPSGVPVADEYYGPTGAYRGTETCDVAAYLWSQIMLLSVSGEGRLADRAERAFFNAGPATVARDFKTHVYFQCPNRIVDKCPPHPHGPRAEGNSYKTTHYPLCCTAALNRILPNYVMHMWMATYDNGLAATHYGPCKVSALVADRVPVAVTCRTDYPFNDVIEMSVTPDRAATFPLLFRIPGWCKNPELSVNGSAVNVETDTKAFVRIERQWQAGDAVRLRLPMAVSVTTGRDKNAHDAPYASVSYGPLLFALPIPDTEDANTPDSAARWRFALDVQREDLASDIRVERVAMPVRWDWPLASPVRLYAKGIACDWNPDPETPLPLSPVAQTTPAEPLTLIPYGCTKFRVSMFPVTERMLDSWKLENHKDMR